MTGQINIYTSYLLLRPIAVTIQNMHTCIQCMQAFCRKNISMVLQESDCKSWNRIKCCFAHLIHVQTYMHLVCTDNLFYKWKPTNCMQCQRNDLTHTLTQTSTMSLLACSWCHDAWHCETSSLQAFFWANGLWVRCDTTAEQQTVKE